MRKIWAVIRREFVERVRTKAFWIFAVLGPAFFAAIVFLPLLLAERGGIKRIAIVDGTTSDFGSQLAAELGGARGFRVERVAAGLGLIDSLTSLVGQKRLDGFLIVSDDAVETGAAEYRASNVSALTTLERLERTLGRLAMNRRLEREGVSPAIVQRARVDVNLTTKKISRGRTTTESAAQSFSLAYFTGILLYIAIVLFGVGVMTSVLEEKTNRVVEILLSSLRPFQMMFGKVVGVAAVSLLQFLIWGVSAKVLFGLRGTLAARMSAEPGGASEVFRMPHVSGEALFVFLAYFLGGFLLYSAMFAAVGAMSSTQQEAQQAQQPVTLLLLVSFISMFAMLNDPDSRLAVTLSLIPFTSPIAMPVRWSAGSVPALELAASLAFLLLGAVGVTWVAARIYRVGILMTGKRPNLKELVRWVRAA